MAPLEMYPPQVSPARLDSEKLEAIPVWTWNKKLELRSGATTIGMVIYWSEAVLLPISWFPVRLWGRLVPRFQSQQGQWELRKGCIIRDLNLGTEIGRIERRDRQICITDGPTYQLVPTNFWKDEFALTALDVGNWATIKQKVPGFPGALRLSVDPIASKIPNSIQALLLAAYLVHEHFRDYWITHPPIGKD